jgi:hypothetical protein
MREVDREECRPTLQVALGRLGDDEVRHPLSLPLDFGDPTSANSRAYTTDTHFEILLASSVSPQAPVHYLDTDSRWRPQAGLPPVVGDQDRSVRSHDALPETPSFVDVSKQLKRCAEVFF